MAIKELVPSSLSSASAWTDGGFANLANPVNTTIPSTRNASSFGDQLFYNLTDLPSSVLAVQSVDARWRRGFNTTPDTGNFMNFALYLSGSATTVETTAASGTAMTGYFTALAKPGGGSWTPADVNNLLTRSTADRPEDALATARVYYYGVRITHKLNVGGFAHLVGSLAGAALGLAEMSALARAVYRKTRTRIMPDEYITAWREVRGARWPRTFEMRGALWV